MAWYSTGTVAVTENSPTVTGTGTQFSSNVRVGDAFIAPDGRLYEVSNVASSTVMSIKPNYRGSTASGQPYAVAPILGYDKELSDRFNLIANQWGGTLAGIQPWATAPTPAQARSSLELRSAAQADIGTTLGNAMPVGAFGIGSERPDRAPSIHRYATSVEIFDSTTVDSVATGISNGSVLTIGYDGSDLRGAQMFFGQVPASTVKGRCGKFSSAPIFEFYTTINTTRATDGTLRAASPVVRIANVAASVRPDLNELDFEPAGAWGVANAEARGVTVQRLDVGVYQISGCLGLATEGWRVIDPASPDGGHPLGITDNEQAEDGTVTIRLFKQRWTLSDDGEMVLGKGAPLDVPLNSWIDVRLSMPAPPEMQPETL